MREIEGKKYYLIREVAEMVDRSYTFVRSDIMAGRLKATMLPLIPDNANNTGYAYFIEEDDIPAYKEITAGRAGGWKLITKTKRKKKIVGTIRVTIPEDFDLEKLTKPYYGTSELAKILGWQTDRVTSYATRGILKAEKMGTCYVIMKEDIGPFVDKIKKQLQKQGKTNEQEGIDMVFTKILEIDTTTITKPFYSLTEVQELFGWKYPQTYIFFTKKNPIAERIVRSYIITGEKLIAFIKDYQEKNKPTPEPVELFTEPIEPAPSDYLIECKSRRVQLLFQPSLYDKLKERADAEHDSVNNLVVRLLTSGVQDITPSELN